MDFYLAVVQDDDYTNYCIACQVRRHIVHTLAGGGGQHHGSMGDSMLLITAKSGTEVLSDWAHMTFSLFCPTSLRGFCSSFTVIDLKASIIPVLPADRSDFDVHWALEDDKVHEYVIL